MLLLDYSDWLLRPEDSDIKHKLVINGSEIKQSKEGLAKLPIVVRTYWGVPRWVADLVKWCLALIAFVLTYPLVVLPLQRLLITVFPRLRPPKE